jgi:hypothetical protein
MSFDLELLEEEYLPNSYINIKETKKILQNQWDQYLNSIRLTIRNIFNQNILYHHEVYKDKNILKLYDLLETCLLVIINEDEDIANVTNSTICKQYQLVYLLIQEIPWSIPKLMIDDNSNNENNNDILTLINVIFRKLSSYYSSQPKSIIFFSELYIEAIMTCHIPMNSTYNMNISTSTSLTGDLINIISHLSMLLSSFQDILSLTPSMNNEKLFQCIDEKLLEKINQGKNNSISMFSSRIFLVFSIMRILIISKNRICFEKILRRMIISCYLIDTRLGCRYTSLTTSTLSSSSSTISSFLSSTNKMDIVANRITKILYEDNIKKNKNKSVKIIKIIEGEIEIDQDEIDNNNNNINDNNNNNNNNTPNNINITTHKNDKILFNWLLREFYDWRFIILGYNNNINSSNNSILNACFYRIYYWFSSNNNNNNNNNNNSSPISIFKDNIRLNLFHSRLIINSIQWIEQSCDKYVELFQDLSFLLPHWAAGRNIVQITDISMLIKSISDQITNNSALNNINTTNLPSSNIQNTSDISANLSPSKSSNNISNKKTNQNQQATCQNESFNFLRPRIISIYALIFLTSEGKSEKLYLLVSYLINKIKENNNLILELISNQNDNELNNESIFQIFIKTVLIIEFLIPLVTDILIINDHIVWEFIDIIAYFSIELLDILENNNELKFDIKLGIKYYLYLYISSIGYIMIHRSSLLYLINNNLQSVDSLMLLFDDNNSNKAMMYMNESIRLIFYNFILPASIEIRYPSNTITINNNEYAPKDDFIGLSFFNIFVAKHPEVSNIIGKIVIISSIESTIPQIRLFVS